MQGMGGMQMQPGMMQPRMPMQQPPQNYAPPINNMPQRPPQPLSAQAPVTPQMGNQSYGNRPLRAPSFSGTRVDMLDSSRAIGTQIAAETKGFLPFEQIAADPQQLRLDYERL